MDTSDPVITFDDNGFCNHCSEYLEVRAPHRAAGRDGERQLERLIEEIKSSGKGRDYDCIVGVSGGVDSSYVACLLKRYGLRILAVHMDNGWDSEESVSNIRNLTGELGIDYQSYVLDWEEFRDLQVSFLKASVPEAETPTDIAIPAALHQFAAKHSVKTIVSAGNLATEGILPKSWHYNAKDTTYLKHIHSKFGTTRLKKFPTFDFKQEAFFKLVRGIRVVYPMNLVEPPPEGLIGFLRGNFGYRPTGEKHHESRYTRFIQSFYLFEKFGIDYRRAKLSSEICNGLTTREIAIERLLSKPYSPAFIHEEKPYIAKKLRLTLEELEGIIRLPPKYFWDYPNDERKLNFVYAVYRRLFGKERLASF